MPPAQGQLGSGCRHANDYQKAFVDYVWSLQLDGSLLGEDPLSVIRQDYPPSLLPLYGLSDSGDYWHRTITQHLTEDMRMNATEGYLSLFMKQVDKKFRVMTGTYVYDSLLCGNANS